MNKEKHRALSLLGAYVEHARTIRWGIKNNEPTFALMKIRMLRRALDRLETIIQSSA